MRALFSLTGLALFLLVNGPQARADESSVPVQLDLRLPHFRGTCDLHRSAYVRESSIRMRTYMVAALKTPKTSDHEGCSLTFRNLSPSVTAMAVTYEQPAPDQVLLSFEFGEVEAVTTLAEDERLHREGYRDLHLTGRLVYKLKTTARDSVRGTCGAPTKEGLYGLRRTVIRCDLEQGYGTVTLEKR